MRTTERLTELIRSKHHVLVELCEAGRRQSAMIEGGEIGGLLSLLAAKQTLITSLQAVERELRPYYAEDPDRRTWRSADDRAACARQAAECNALLDEIMQLEKHGAEKMAIRRNEVAEQLQHVHAATHVRTAYEAHRRTPA